MVAGDDNDEAKQTVKFRSELIQLIMFCDANATNRSGAGNEADVGKKKTERRLPIIGRVLYSFILTSVQKMLSKKYMGVSDVQFYGGVSRQAPTLPTWVTRTLHQDPFR